MGEFNVYTILPVIKWLVYVLGIPGNILSAIVWLRRRKNSSAIYLATLAINDLVVLLIRLGRTVALGYLPSYIIRKYQVYWLLASCIEKTVCDFEPLLILAFSIERLFAIVRPFKVSFPCIIIGLC